MSAGFPSPADDFIQSQINLNDLLVEKPASTYLVRVTGNSMLDDHICDGDILVVDRSLNNTSNQIVVAIVDGEFLVKRLLYQGNKCFLVPSNNQYHSIEITTEMNCIIWGVVTYVIHATK
ncbi:MAG: LexA family protein [Dehalococcoidia bacterium]